MLEARGLTKYYSAITGVRDVNFSVRPGEVLGLLGPNGSGKSTTVGMLTGLLDQSGGVVTFGGADHRRQAVEDLRPALAFIRRAEQLSVARFEVHAHGIERVHRQRVAQHRLVRALLRKPVSVKVITRFAEGGR